MLVLHSYADVANVRPPQSAAPVAESRPAATEQTPAAAARPAALSVSEGASANVLGKTDTQSGESRRNENIQFNLIDNNGMQELRKRLGTSATIVSDFSPVRSYFGAEFGTAPGTPIHLPSGKPTSAIHGTAFWTHSNSATTARSFFQVGGVQPARENEYGVSALVPLWRKAWLSVDGSQQKLRGQVNGNILVPRPEERVPLATDPRIRSIIERWMRAYPTTLPNRPDIDPRALNTNAPQLINTDNSSLRFEQVLGSKDRLVARHTYMNQRVDAFQFVAGQNPDTTTKNHSARLTWQRVFRPQTVGQFTLGFDRAHSLLVPEANAVGPQVQIGTVYTTLGPGSGIPIDRMQNRFRYAALVTHQSGRHQLSFGGSLTRLQFNGREVSSNRGNWYFRNDFGRDAITNFRLGIPSRFSFGQGELARGFRNWEQHYFVADTIKVRSNLTLSTGLRYQPQSGPYEVNGLTDIPFHCDCNNLAPSFGLAWRLPPRWGVVRAAYSVQFGEIFATTFQSLRWNPPQFLKPEVQAPDLLNPLAGADLSPTGRATVFVLPSNLVSPYSHQYNASWEMVLANKWRLQLGYVGSRSHKLFLLWHTNRAHPVAGIAQTTATINDRRANPRLFEVRPVMNGSRAYFDAARATLVVPEWRGVTLDFSYWFSKALDNGGNFLNTGAGDDARQGYSQSESILQPDLRAVSAFDQSHALLSRLRYQLPRLGAHRLLRETVGGWGFSGVWLAKTGMPFSVIAGSDGPGFGNVDGTNGDRPNILDPSILGRAVNHPDDSARLLPRAAFGFIRPTDERGNIGLNTFRRGGILNLNLGLSKTWSATGERRVTLRGEAINATNSPQFAEPNPDLSSPAFGKITNTLNDGRAFRFTLQLQF